MKQAAGLQGNFDVKILKAGASTPEQVKAAGVCVSLSLPPSLSPTLARSPTRSFARSRSRSLSYSLCASARPRVHQPVKQICKSVFTHVPQNTMYPRTTINTLLLCHCPLKP